MSKLVIVKLGNAEQAILPTAKAIQRMQELLAAWDGKSDLRLVWDDLVEVVEVELQPDTRFAVDSADHNLKTTRPMPSGDEIGMLIGGMLPPHEAGDRYELKAVSKSLDAETTYSFGPTRDERVGLESVNFSRRGKPSVPWMFVHNCVVHPLMGVCELLTWNRYVPSWLERAHEWTAQKAGF